MTVIYLILAFILYSYSYYKSKDLWHPLGVASFFWFICVALSSYEPLYDPVLQSSWSFNMHFAVLISGLIFAFPLTFSKLKETTPRKGAIYFTLSYLMSVNFLMIASIAVFCLRFKTIIFTPPLLFSGGVDAKDMVPEALVGFNYIELLIPFLAVFCIFELRFSSQCSRTRKVFLYGYIFFYITTSIFYKVTRGDLILFIFGFIYLYFVSGGRITFKLFKYVALILVGIGFFTSKRLVEGSAVLSRFGEDIFSIFFSIIYTYVAYNFENLNKLISSDFSLTYFWGANKYFMHIFFRDEYMSGNTGLLNFETLFFNAKTYLYYFYHDLDMIGVILYPLLISSIVQIIYNLSVVRYRFIILVAVLQKAIVFLFFGNYFFGELVLLFPYIITLLLVFMLKSQYVSGRRNF